MSSLYKGKIFRYLCVSVLHMRLASYCSPIRAAWQVHSYNTIRHAAVTTISDIRHHHLPCTRQTMLPVLITTVITVQEK